MSKRFKPYIEVVVEYEVFDTTFDDKLEEKADLFGGTRGGSGYGFGKRDISFEFNSLEGAAKFVKAVYKFKKTEHVFSRSHLYDNDYDYK